MSLGTTDLDLDLAGDSAADLRCVTATFTSVSADVATLHTSDGEDLLLPVTEWYPTRAWVVGERTVAVRTLRGSRPWLSVTSPHLVSALLDGIVPEVREGIVRVMGVARAPGIRTKIAVAATVADIDPVLVCVGRSANRVKELTRLLHGERVDIIAWNPDPAVYLKNALAPAQVSSARITDKTRGEIEVTAPRHQMAAAVGEKGLNSSLAGQLCGVTVTVVPG